MAVITDSKGNVIHLGWMVRVITIPEWLTHDLPHDEVIRLKATRGSIMRVIEIDKFGFIWLGADASNNGWFCLKPSDIEVVEEK